MTIWYNNPLIICVILIVGGLYIGFKVIEPLTDFFIWIENGINKLKEKKEK